MPARREVKSCKECGIPLCEDRQNLPVSYCDVCDSMLESIAGRNYWIILHREWEADELRKFKIKRNE